MYTKINVKRRVEEEKWKWLIIIILLLHSCCLVRCALLYHVHVFYFYYSRETRSYLWKVETCKLHFSLCFTRDDIMLYLKLYFRVNTSRYNFREEMFYFFFLFAALGYWHDSPSELFLNFVVLMFVRCMNEWILQQHHSFYSHFEFEFFFIFISFVFFGL